MLLFIYTNYRSCEMFWRFIWILKFEISTKKSACCIISSCKSVSHTEVILLQWCCTLWLATFHSWRPSETLELYLSQSESVLGGTDHGRIGMVLMMVFLGMWMIYSLVSWQVQLAHVPICCFLPCLRERSRAGDDVSTIYCICESDTLHLYLDLYVCIYIHISW